MYEKYKYHFLAVVQDVNRLIQKIDVTTVDQTELLRWKTLNCVYSYIRQQIQQKEWIQTMVSLFVDRGEKSIVD